MAKDSTSSRMETSIEAAMLQETRTATVSWLSFLTTIYLGTYTHASGAYYAGDFVNNLQEGYGKSVSISFILHFTFLGVYYFPSGAKFMGNYQNDLK